MQTKPTAQDDCTIETIPPIQATLPDDVTSVEVVGPFRLRVTLL